MAFLITKLEVNPLMYLRSILPLVLACLLSLPAQAQLNLDTWDSLLGAAVSNGFVDYRQWRDNSDFDALVQQVATTDTDSMSREELLVIYINAYNILAARGILDGSSPSSLLGRYVYFKRDKYTVAGQRINLYDLEHELIRPLGEARIHFAIVCASHSCPILRDEAYRLQHLDAQLDDAARGFINDPERNRFDPAGAVAELSRIFDWFEEDFVAASGSVQSYLADYVEQQNLQQQLRAGGMKIRHLDYDWRLNGVK